MAILAMVLFFCVDEQQANQTMTAKVHIVSLGCPKNLVDSEVMAASLEEAAYTISSSPEDADLLVVNTCGFIQPAVEEAIDTILEMAEYKAQDPAKRLVVAGCLVQRYGSELVAELPEVDLFVGVDEIAEIGRLVSAPSGNSRLRYHVSPHFLMDVQTSRRLTDPPFQAYLKITEGCDNRCSYCLIPAIRGRLRSRAIDDVVAEAQRLEKAGVRELGLIAQDLTSYGRDRSDGASLEALLTALLENTTIPWIRLLYLYPSAVSHQLLELMSSEKRIVEYLDIPFQHVSDRILQQMNRRYGRNDLERLIDMICEILPECALRTSLIVGFPGETEEDFTALLTALESWQLDHVGVFQYQDEEGTKAHELADKVDPAEKEERYQRVMSLQAEISRRRCQRFVGQQVEVLVSGYSQETNLLLEGRTRHQAPEIDGKVYITEGMAARGEVVTVQIDEAHTYDLVGRIVEQPF